MVRYMPFTSWIANTWSRGGCGGRFVFAFLLVLIIWPFWLIWLPFDLLIGFLRHRKANSYPYSLIAIDLETTGLSPKNDEILSIGIVGDNGVVLMNELVRPTRRKTWKSAQAVNGISPEMVAHLRSFTTFRPRVQDIINNSGAVLFYNADFDVPFLEAAGVVMTRPVIDVMLEYAQRTGGRWVKLVEAANAMGIEVQNAHAAIADAAATMELHRRMQARR